jgi:hypothetical protein
LASPASLSAGRSPSGQPLPVQARKGFGGADTGRSPVKQKDPAAAVATRTRQQRPSSLSPDHPRATYDTQTMNVHTHVDKDKTWE